jgi:hypothetical protein
VRLPRLVNQLRDRREFRHRYCVNASRLTLVRYSVPRGGCTRLS